MVAGILSLLATLGTADSFVAVALVSRYKLGPVASIRPTVTTVPDTLVRLEAGEVSS